MIIVIDNKSDDEIYEGEVYEGDVVEDSDEEEKTEWMQRHEQREALRESIKQRVRNTTVNNEFFHPGKPTPKINDESNKRVAVYARVSTTNIEQTSSIENQQKFYTKKVNETPNWELQNIYSDEGKSGTNAEHRPAFQQMINDAIDGKMDMIICASVSRFARNISQCLDYVSELRTKNPKHPVGVYFETENIYTLNPDSEQALTMHAMLADWESANKSRRMILSYDQRICTGQYQVVDLLGYRHTKDGELIIQEDEAKTVRYVFIALILGKNCNEISKDLSKMKRKTLTGKVEWNGSMVQQIITNERRWGDLEARKSIVLDYKKKKIVSNNGTRDWAYVPDHHEGIVTKEIAKAAQLMASSQGLLRKGVPELKVIDKGALKGYVSVIPHWNEVDSDAYLNACNSVYSKADLKKITKEMRIWKGEEKSNVLSMSFTGYQVPPGIVFLTNSMPSLTISYKGIKFNKACFNRLDNPKWIEMFYHPLLNSIVVRAADPEFVNSFKWMRDNGNPINNIETRAFSSVVYMNMDWYDEYSFKFRGILKERGGAKLLCFSLDEPQILVGKKRKKRCSENDLQKSSGGKVPKEIKNVSDKSYDKMSDKPTDNTNTTDRTTDKSSDEMQDALQITSQNALKDDMQTVHYINYTNDKVSETVSDNIIAFPAEWRGKHIGKNLIMRNNREAVFKKLSEEDINEVGTPVNESVSSMLPDRQELENELKELLQSM